MYVYHFSILINQAYVQFNAMIPPIRYVNGFRERGVVQWSERGASPLPLSVVWVQSSLDASFQRNIMFLLSQRWDIVSMFVSLGRYFILMAFIALRCKWVPGRTGDVNAYDSFQAAVFSPCLKNGTRMNRSTPVTRGELSNGVQTWWQTIILHLYFFVYVSV